LDKSVFRFFKESKFDSMKISESMTADLPLSGLRVLEFSQIMAGPTCGLMLSDLGAKVIKIEKFPGGDDARGYQRPGDPGLAPSFLMLNRGKRSAAIDIRTPQGKKLITRLVAQTDVVTENFRAGKMDSLGFGFDALKKINPKLIYCSISGYGAVGPMKDKGGFDLVLQAFTGLISVTGTDSGEVVKPGNSVADINAGLLAAFGVLAAYVRLLKTGEGGRVETSLLQAGLQQMYWFAAAYFSQGIVAKPVGTAHPLIAPYQVFKCKGGAIAIGGGNQNNWERIAKVLGNEAWIKDERFKTGRTRLANRKVLEQLIEAELAHKTQDEWLSAFETVDVPAGPVNDVAQALDDRQTLAVEMVVEADHADGGTFKSVGNPLHIDGRSTWGASAAPYLGQQTREILEEVGLTTPEIDQLIQEKVIFQHEQ
jgi:crotonobetainyl-CoA:carnitine CoA-transferase CaiB-like acyl-CoA transferase